VIVGSDFNVDFTRNRLHTLMLDNFCVDMHPSPVAKHSKYSINYTYNFDMIWFNVLDHLLLSDIIFNTAVVFAHVMHGVDNISDHEPIILQLCFQLRYLGSVIKFTLREFLGLRPAIPICIIIGVHCLMNFVLLYYRLKRFYVLICNVVIQFIFKL